MSSVLRSLIAWILVTSPVAECVASTYLADGYSIRVWQTEDGLPQNLVTSAVQTHDGYLWFGTQSGLARFDGERFETFDPSNAAGFATGLISCLYEDAEGTLWIGHQGGEITRYRSGHFERFETTSAAKHELVFGIGSDEQGHRWAMRTNGVVESLDQLGDLPSLIGADRATVTAWSRSTGGAIWLARNGRVARISNGQLLPQVLQPSSSEHFVIGVAAAADGGAWILCDQRIRKWNGARWTEDRGDDPSLEMVVSSCLELRDGTLVIGTIYSGLYLVFKDGRRPVHLDHSKGLPQNWVRCLYEDREGNLWAGLGRAGLVSIRSTAFSTLNAQEQWRGCAVLSVAPGRDGTLWVGTDGATLHRYSAGEWTGYGSAQGLNNWFVPSVVETAQGEVWASDNWWGGPYRLDGGQFVRPLSVDPASSPALALLPVSGTDDLLVGNSDGVRKLHGDTSTWLIKSTDKSKGAVCALAQDRDGAIWCGFTQGGVASFLNGEIKYFRKEDGLASNFIKALHVDEEGSVWIGTADSGLTRLKNGRVARLGVAQGLLDRFIAHILDDGLGYLWLSTHHGLQRIAKEELNRCADGFTTTFPSQIYDQHDGLPIIEFMGGLQAAGCKTSDGRLWFATSKGLLGVDPAHIVPNPLAPPVVLGALRVDGKRMSDEHDSIAGELAPDHQRLEFSYSGLSFAAPNKVRFKYRLEGIDRDWIDAGAKRTAFYSRLPAGSYRFRVIACNNDGVWNLEGATLAFSVAPFFWETWWFIGSSALLALVGVAVLVRTITRRRMQKRLELLERQHALESERARIAQDIHDDVGTSLIRIAMFSQPERTELDHPQQTAAVLSRIYSTAREMTRALDEIVWAIDPRHDTLDSLIGYMGRFAQESLGAATIRCRLDVPVDVPAWPLTAEIRHNLFLAFKEGLNNVIKHAAATEVRFSLEVREHDFVLALHDNGRGFDRDRPTASTDGRIASGNGLRNIEQRVARIGGRCEISTQPGQGTGLSFIIPIPASAPAFSRRHA